MDLFGLQLLCPGLVRLRPEARTKGRPCRPPDLHDLPPLPCARRAPGDRVVSPPGGHRWIQDGRTICGPRGPYEWICLACEQRVSSYVFPSPYSVARSSLPCEELVILKVHES